MGFCQGLGENKRLRAVLHEAFLFVDVGGGGLPAAHPTAGSG